MAKAPSYLFDNAIQDGIDYAFGHLLLRGSLLHQNKKAPSHTFGGSLLD